MTVGNPSKSLLATLADYTLQGFTLAVGVAILVWSSCVPAASQSHNESAAAAHLRDEADVVPCGENEFLFGVAYIDGSYMERIFLAQDEADAPRLEVTFRAPRSWPDGTGKDLSQDLSPMPFTLELWAPRSRYALPSGGQWRVPPQEWETALRFKYTNWYGEISRTGGRWKVDWQGFRRPMLPDSVKENRQDICRQLAEP